MGKARLLRALKKPILGHEYVHPKKSANGQSTTQLTSNYVLRNCSNHSRGVLPPVTTPLAPLVSGRIVGSIGSCRKLLILFGKKRWSEPSSETGKRREPSETS